MLEFSKGPHKKTISLSTLKRYLKKENYFHRPMLARGIKFKEFKEMRNIKEVLHGSESNLGYGKV